MLRQYSQGIQVGLVRLSDLEQEADLVHDFGIYGDTAAGYQTTDEIGQTVQYEMRFGSPRVRLAEDRWRRLSLYIQPFESLSP